ncbi:hypothetical protein [Tepidibacter hydrothermalis]|uniref:DUF4367 domain-containing protein n=1 Tax=Tepidibacter hydrothermalis TaxID=3036126 RepID=A0ABY8EFX1_9FIRM|nr:hypothetical protein [Tepidibacter hydrothermalis]WFD10649.1 hypothetical protein P4S50_00825 [Tepidibacter hydrothermalis]
MKNMRLESKIKDHFNGVSIPEVDVSNKVMNRIINPTLKTNIFIKKKYAIIALSVIFIITTGFAVSKLITMKDKEGNILWTYNEGTNEYAHLNKMMDDKQTKLKLKPGESVALYVNKDNPSEFMRIISEPIITNEFSEIQKNMSDYLKFPEVLLQKYNFTEGRISKEPKDVNTEEIFREAAKTTTYDNPVFVKYIDLSDNVTGIGTTYSDGVNTININMFPWIGNDIISYEENSSKKQKIELEDYEVLYEEEENNKRVFWIKNEVYYTISSHSKEVSIQNLIKIADTIIKLNE